MTARRHWFSPIASIYGGTGAFLALAGGPVWAGLPLLVLAGLVLLIERRV